MSHSPRTIKSFVRRQGRLTPSQKATLSDLEAHACCQSPTALPALIAATSAKIVMDIGFGMGDSLLALASALPDHLIIGVEVYPAGIASAIQKLASAGHQNVVLVQDDVMEVLQHVPDQTLAAVQLLYPDPWSKVRHHKRRLVQRAWLASLSPLMQQDGWLHVITDHDDYGLHIAECFAQSGFELVDCPPVYDAYCKQLETKYQRRAARLGHARHVFHALNRLPLQ